MNSIAHWLLVAYLILLPTQLGTHFWPPDSLVLGRRIDYLSPTLYLTDFVLLGALLANFWVRRRLLRPRWIPLAVVVFLLSLVAGYFLIQGETASAFYWLRLVTFILFGWLVVIGKWSLPTVVWPLAMGVWLTVSLTLIQFFHQQSIGGAFYFLGERTFTIDTPAIAKVAVDGRQLLRPYATFPHPNVLAGYLSILLPLFFAPLSPILGRVSVVLSRCRYFLWQLTRLLLLVGIFLSFSRVAWLVTFILLSWQMYARSSRRRLQTVKAVIFLCLVIFIEELMVGRFASLLSDDSQSVRERQQLVEASLTMTATSPLFGVGLGRFIPALARFTHPSYLLQPVHNIYLLVLAETGLVGMGVSIVAIVWFIRRGLIHQYRPLLQSLAAILLLGLFDHYFLTIHQTRGVFALILALILV